MRVISIGHEPSKMYRTFKENSKVSVPEQDVAESRVKEKKANGKEKVLPLASAALAAVSLGVAIYATRGKNTTEQSKKTTDQALEKAKDEMKDLVKKAEEKVEEKVTDIGNKLSEAQKKISEKNEFHDKYLDALDNKVKDISARPTEVHAKVNMDRNWIWSVEGMRLRQNSDNGGARKRLKTDIAKKIRDTADIYINGKKGPLIATLGAASVIWLPSAETKPEKEGGLGEVPVQMATNFVKEYDITESYIPRPLMEIPGKSWIKKVDNNWLYWYDGLKNEKGEESPMNVDKLAEFETVAYHNGYPAREKVEVFYGIDPAGGYKRLMFRNPNYFAADGLYAGTETAEEPERYTFFSRALYDFMKLLKDPNSLTYAQMEHPTLLKSIKAPDALVLNDWHVAPLAALMRTLAPVEASDKKLNGNVAKQLENTRLMYIVHNADYQGNEYHHREDLLNTLFGQYTADIVENAKTGHKETFINEYEEEVTKEINDLQSPFMIGNTVNMANMAMSYADIVKPVSVTYAKELAEQSARSLGLQHVASVRLGKQTMIGQSNGWDRSVNEVSQANLKGFNDKLNEDKFTIFKHTINNVKDLTASERDAINQIFAEQEKLDMNTFDIVYAKLDRLNIPKLDETLKELKEAGVTELRTFLRATCDMPEEELFAARKHNKRMFFEHVKSIIEYDKKHPDAKLFNIQELENTDLSSIDIEKLDEIPTFNMGVRFVEQKGVDVVSQAWLNILSRWDELFPEKPRPIINIGGKDPSADGDYKKMIKTVKEKLGDKGKTLIQWDGYVPNNILMAGSDWTMRPSHFEPDGDKWESLYKGTPMVMTKVGGHIDSIQDDVNGFLTARTVPEIEKYVDEHRDPKKSREEQILDEKVKDYSAALIRALNKFYDKDAYQKMALNAIKGNQSWVIKDKDGKIIDCSSIKHMKDLGFDLSKFPQISESVYKEVENA